jgi:hypothetical protein
VLQTLDTDATINELPAWSEPACDVSQKAECTPAGIATTIESFCNRFVADGKTLGAGSQLSGDAYNYSERYTMTATFTVRTAGIDLTREACIEAMRFVQEGCVVRTGAQCASGQAETKDRNIVASISFS